MIGLSKKDIDNMQQDISHIEQLLEKEDVSLYHHVIKPDYLTPVCTDKHLVQFPELFVYLERIKTALEQSIAKKEIKGNALQVLKEAQAPYVSEEEGPTAL